MPNLVRPLQTERFGRIACLIVFAIALWPTTTYAGRNTSGHWTPPSPSWGHMQIHLALMPGDATYHTKLLSWSFYHDTPVMGSFWGWKPDATTTNNNCDVYPAAQFTPLNAELAGVPNLFCAGASSLSTGELLISGGTDMAPFIGHRQSILFRPNPASGQSRWAPQGKLNAGRWYPTNTSLPDGKVMVFSGERFKHLMVFGGTESPQIPTSTTREDVHRLGLDGAGQWLSALSRPINETNWAEAREGHTAVWYQDDHAMIVFGGRTLLDQVTNTVWWFQAGEQGAAFVYNWQQLFPGGLQPPSRTRHSAVVLSDCAFRPS